jgi:predicted transposase YdaD
MTSLSFFYKVENGVYTRIEEEEIWREESIEEEMEEEEKEERLIDRWTEKERKQIALRMKNRGCDVDLIALALDLSTEEVQNLQPESENIKTNN